MTEKPMPGMEPLLGAMTLSYTEPFGHPVHTVMMTFSVAMTAPKIQIVTVDGRVHDLPQSKEVEDQFNKNFGQFSDMMGEFAKMIREGNIAAHLKMKKPGAG